MRTLILGGARSGKSRLAQQMALASARAVSVIVTAQALDEEMIQRIARHRAERPEGWRTVEAPIALAAALRECDRDDGFVIIDCLTLWLSNLLLADDEAQRAAETQALLAAIASTRGELVLVANETGLGVVPANALSRLFRDEAGTLHQTLAAQCDRVALTVAGLPMWLKGEATGE